MAAPEFDHSIHGEEELLSETPNRRPDMNSPAPSAYAASDEQIKDLVDTSDSDSLSFANIANDAPAGTRAVPYLRVSSKGQVNTDYDPEGISIPAQRESCLRKVEQMGLTVVTEYIEPGRSGTEMTKRVAFQEMLRRVRADRDVDYVVVYKLSRFARNRTDDAIVMADLKKRGVTLISATESIDASPVGQLMHGLLAAFNEYRSAEDGADIKYKMSQKAKKGGTIGRAPVGYLNVREYFEGREVRSVTVDELRGPLIRQAFELYATGDYTFADLSEAMEDRGLTTKPSAKRPSKAISPTYFSRLLRDRYYCGIITLDGAEHPGRHDALVPDDLFHKVQQLLDSRGVAGERRRVHEHYLKGALYCDNCHKRGIVHRMVIQRSIGRSGNQYFYFFCAGRTVKDCSTSHISTARLEDAMIRQTPIHARLHRPSSNPNPRSPPRKRDRQSAPSKAAGSHAAGLRRQRREPA
jgi:site-specific DNA recombinase